MKRNQPGHGEGKLLLTTVLSVCMAMVAALALPTAALVTSLTSAAPAAAATVPNPANQLRLDVTPAMKSLASNWPDKVGQPLKHYKWLIQADNSGDPAQPSGPLASNDGTITCGVSGTSSTCTLTSPSAPFQYSGNGSTPDAASPDLHVAVSGDGLTGATITAVQNATTVTVHRGAPLTSLNTAGTYLFTLLRSDPCHPVTPVTPQGDQNFPANCNWPSIHSQDHPPVVTQGDQADWSTTQSLSGVMQKAMNGCAANHRAILRIATTTSLGGGGGGGDDGCGLTLPAGKYFVSVTADGYEIGGTNFTVPMNSDPGTNGRATVKVGLNPGPLTLGTMKILVFDDMAPTGGWWEQTTEAGMSGFTGFITDFTGFPVTQDYFGNPICTTYKTDLQGHTLVKPDGSPQQIVKLGGQCTSQPVVLGTLASPILVGGTSLKVTLVPGATTQNIPRPGVNEQPDFNVKVDNELLTVTHVSANGLTWTINPATQVHTVGANVPDPSNQPISDGVISIPNLAPGRYGANVIPPDKAWIQTSTLEGSKEHDVWLTGNDSGLDTEMVVAGEPVPWVNLGFARAAMATINPAVGTLCTFSQSPPAQPQAARTEPCTRPTGSTQLNEAVPHQGNTNDPAAWAALHDPALPVLETDPGTTPTSGAFVVAGCMVAPLSAADGALPTGDIRAQFTVGFKPCGGTNLTPRIYPGVPGQAPTPDGSLQADSWEFPWYNPEVYKLNAAPTGEIKGTVAAEEAYVPGAGGFNGVAGGNGQAGEKVANIKISDGWVALADLNNGDQTAMVLPTKDDGTFDITHVPDGTYNLAWWDWSNDYGFDQYQVIVQNGQVIDVGMLPLMGWFANISGHVFIDKNGNGKQDPGEPGVPDFLMQMLNRTNNLYEQGTKTAVTNDSGYYDFAEGYPLGQDEVLQFYNPRYKTTGVTCQMDNDPQHHTTITPAVDLSTLNIIALNGYCDIGVQPYSTDPTANDNGGIVATAMYHSFRAELSVEQAFTTTFDTGQPGVRVELWQPRPVGTSSNGGTKYATCTKPLPAPLPAAQGPYNPCPNGADGSLVRDPVNFDSGNQSQVDVYESEHWGRGGNAASVAQGNPGCVPRTADGQVMDYGTQQAIKPGGECIESALQGTSFAFGTDGNPVDPNLYKNTITKADWRSLDPGFNPGPYQNLPDTYPGLNAYCDALNPVPPADNTSVVGSECGLHGVQTVDGNYGLTPPVPGDYIVHAIIPNDMFGKPLYKWATDATNNTYEGPGWISQNADPSTLSWPITPQVPSTPKPTMSPGYGLTPSTGSPSPYARCVGPSYTVNNTNPAGPDYTPNPAFVAAYGGTPPFEGQVQQLCDSKLIHVQNGQSYAPNFLLYTDVPLATKFAGYATDDVSVSANHKSTALGEVQPIVNMPTGIYDWTGRQVAEVNTDYNGQWELLLPSTNTFNCNDVLGPCPSVYNFVGNDPGQPASPNLNWNPAYITIRAQFQAYPDVFSPSDVAPTRAVVQFEGNGSNFLAASVCAPQASQPELFTVSHPFLKPFISGAPAGAARNGRTDSYTLTIQGVGFGTRPSNSQLSADPRMGVTLRKSSSTNDDKAGVIKQFPNANITSWSDTQIVVTLATGSASSTTLQALTGVAPGSYELEIENTSGLTTTSGLTFHVLGSTYNPTILEVGRFNSGLYNQTTGLPVGTKILDNGFIRRSVFNAGTAVAALVDSTTGGFNPANQNFVAPPASPDPNVISTAGATNTGPVPGAAYRPSPGDGTVKGAVQRAIEKAYHDWQRNRRAQDLIVVYPNFQDLGNGRYGGAPFDPLTAYYENIVIHAPLMLQGTGPGGLYEDSTGNTVAVPGATLDGRFFNGNTTAPATTSDTLPNAEPWAADWQQLVGLADNTDGLATSQPFYNSESEDQGEVIAVIGNVGWYSVAPNGFRPTVDGFQVTGGDQKDFPGNIVTEVAGGKPAQAPDETFTIAQQGGALYLNGYAQHFQISNNLFQYNSGTYGAIRSGTPQNFDAPIAHNDDLHIHHNRIIANGGTNLGGAIALFRGTSGYRINDNVICANLSAEYGGGISHFGYSPGGLIDHNRLMLNQSVDEGGAIMIAGEPPIDPNTNTTNPDLLSMGAGPVTIDSNWIGDNLAYDDGAGVRFLEAGAWPFTVVNNTITDNVSSHEGGGIAIDNAPDVRLINDTVANNVTTATALTSTGDPAPAGISTVGYNSQLQNFLAGAGGTKTIQVDTPGGTVPETCAQVTGSAAECTALAARTFSDPLVMDDLVWGNLAGSWDSLHSTVVGIGMAQNLQYSGPAGACPASGALPPCVNPLWDPGPNNWDIGVADGADTTTHIAPTGSLIQSNYGWSGGSGNRVGGPDPAFVQSYMPSIQVDPYRLQPRFRPSSLITLNFPANVLGDYRIPTGSGAQGIDPSGSTTLGWGTAVTSPSTDIVFDARPSGAPAAYDAGAYQLVGAAPLAGGGGPGAPGGGGPAAPGAVAGGGGSAPKTAVLDVGADHSHAVTLPPRASSGPVRPRAGSPAPPSTVDRSGGPKVTPVAPPSGSTIGAEAVGTPDAAGNTPVVQAYGSQVASNGVSGVLPGQGTQAAGMPGGVQGGGHYVLPAHRHRGSSKGGPLGSISNPMLWIPAAVVLLLGALTLRRRMRGARRPRRHVRRHSRASDLPPDDEPAAGPQLVAAGKGDAS